MSDLKMTEAEIQQLVADCLVANGCNQENAAALGRTIASAERDGSASHGLFRMPGYIASLRSGKVNGNAVPKVTRISPAVVKVDGDHGYAPLALEKGREALIEAARENGIAAMALVNVHHFAALWVEVEPIAEAGLAAMAFTTYKPAVVPAGARTPLFGTNPMCFGWPRGDKPPLVFDQASASMARGEVMIAARDGHAVPLGTGVDAEGNSTTDAQKIIDGGALLPFGGHKGSTIAMMIELLVAGLTGMDFSYEAQKNDNNDGGPPNGGEFMLAIDPNRFGDAENWLSHSEAFLECLAGMEGAHMPGNRRYANRAKSASDGISIAENVHASCLEFIKTAR
ncbi:Ldh family oxidoreductase [SAR92 clade bacterium H921]|nr:Ldh family oxidoreductase [SAR92 clade bacterium H921]MDG0971643.1 Ldh family oxidoreductase [Porticoccaceae bacterium]MDG1308720.1 Ldh family oxidoreductase [Porticoccaceae bacterium]